MTTYEFKSGLRLALMKLENSLHSRGGLPRNPTVDLRYPEERMAARLVERLGIKPPIDVERICRGFATLSFKQFPIEIDGLCLDLKIPGKQPKVWVSQKMPTVRKRFTLAHEIGHIIIPWHTGTIVDDIELPRSQERGKYRKMEAEANRFAAELLMPASWVTALSERSDHAAGLMHSIQQIAQVSLPASFLKAIKYGKPGFIGAKVRDGVVIISERTPETNSMVVESGTLISNIEMPAAHDLRIIRGPDLDYYWWKIRETLDDPGTSIPVWRDILEDILSDIPADFRPKTRASVNAIIGLGIGKEPKGAPVNRIYKRGVEAAQNRGAENVWVKHVISHSSFKDYILGRARERSLAKS